MVNGLKKVIKFTILLVLIAIMVNFAIDIYYFVKYPIGYRKYISEYSEEFDVDPHLVTAIINVESRYDKDAESQKGAKGLMQIAPITGQWASEVLGIEGYTEEDLFNPEMNIRIGTWYISRLLLEFDNNLDNVILAYNAGSGNVQKWLKDKDYSSDGKNIDHIPFKETRDYIARVKNSYKVYKTTYDKKILNEYVEDSFLVDILHKVKKIFTIR